MPKYKDAPEEWSAIMAHNIKKYLRGRSYPNWRIDELMDDLVQEGWVSTMKAIGYSSYDDDHDRADAYLLTSVMNNLREWSMVNGPEGKAPEPQYGRSSTGNYVQACVDRGDTNNPAVRNGGWRSVCPGASLDAPIGDSGCLGDIVPTDNANRLLEVESRADLLAAIQDVRARAMAMLRLHGFTFKEIGENLPSKFNGVAGRSGVSLARVQQIWKKHITPMRGELN